MVSLDDLRRRHRLAPADAEVALSLAEALVRRDLPHEARAVVHATLRARSDDTGASEAAARLVRKLVALPSPPHGAWCTVRSLSLGALLEPLPALGFAPRIVGSCLVENDADAVHALVALSDGRLLEVDVGAGTARERYRPTHVPRRSQPAERRQFTLLLDAHGRSVAFRDPPGPFTVLWPEATSLQPQEGSTCVAPLPAEAPWTWLFGGLRGGLTMVSQDGTVRESHGSPGREGTLWAVGCGEDGRLVTLHEWLGLEVREGLRSRAVIHLVDDAMLMSGRARLAIDGERAAAVVREASVLRVYAWRTGEWSEIEVDFVDETSSIAAWSAEPRLRWALAWSAQGESCWLDLVAGTSTRLAGVVFATPPHRVWPDARARFALAVHLDRLELIG